MRRAERRVGSEIPRIFTPPLRELTPQTSLGFLAIEFAEGPCGLELFPWQRWLLIHALELDLALTFDTLESRGPLDPIFRFRKVVVLVARQNGKSTLSQVLSLFFLYILGTALVLGTAQDLDTAEEVWEGAQDIIEESPELLDQLGKVVRNNGKKAIVLKSGERYKVKAANRRAGRGLSGDLILLDELREHQSWDAWGAITKTTMARPAAQIWALSNAGDATSVVLRYLRKSAHAALGDPDELNGPDDPSALLPEVDEIAAMKDDVPDDAEDFGEVDQLGLFEWSAPPGCEVTDRDGWAMSNPSMGYSISERTLAGDAASDVEWVFRTECLCQWSEGTLAGPFPPGSWDAGVDSESRRAPGAEVVACVEVSKDRSMSHIVVAARRADGNVHVEVAASRAGVDWLRGWFFDDNKPDRRTWRVTYQGRGAQVSALGDSFTEWGLAAIPWQGPDLPTGTATFFDLVTRAKRDGAGAEVGLDPGVFHRPDPRLDVPASQAETKRMTDGGWLFDRFRSPVDVSPLIAAAGACWLLGQEKPAEYRSAYEDNDVLIVV